MIAPAEPPRRSGPHAPASGQDPQPGGGAASGPNGGGAALLPRRLLLPDERVLLACKPSLWFVLLHRPMLLLLSMAVWLVPVGVDPGLHGAFTGWLILAGVLLTLLRLSLNALDWLGRIYALTDRRVLRVRGLFHVRVFESPLQRIQNTNLRLPLPERLLGLGTLTFSTAGTSGVEAAWRMVHDPLGRQRAVLAARDGGQAPG